MRSGIQVIPIAQITGQHDFNEAVFRAWSTDDHLLGVVDEAWKQATASSLPMSGPDPSGSSRPFMCFRR